MCPLLRENISHPPLLWFFLNYVWTHHTSTHVKALLTSLISLLFPVIIRCISSLASSLSPYSNYAPFLNRPNWVHWHQIKSQVLVLLHSHLPWLEMLTKNTYWFLGWNLSVTRALNLFFLSVTSGEWVFLLLSNVTIFLLPPTWELLLLFCFWVLLAIRYFSLLRGSGHCLF